MTFIITTIAWILQVISLFLDFPMDYMWHPRMNALNWILPVLGDLALILGLIFCTPKSVWVKVGVIVNLMVFVLWNAWMFLLMEPAMQWERKYINVETNHGPFLVTSVDYNIIDPSPYFYIHRPVKSFPLLCKKVYSGGGSIVGAWEDKEELLLKSQRETMTVRIEELAE